MGENAMSPAVRRFVAHAISSSAERRIALASSPFTACMRRVILLSVVSPTIFSSCTNSLFLGRSGLSVHMVSKGVKRSLSLMPLSFSSCSSRCVHDMENVIPSIATV